MISKVTAAKSVIKSLPLFDKVLVGFYNMFEKKEYFTLHIQAPGSTYLKLLWGAFVYKNGEHRQVTVFCSPGAFNVISKSYAKFSETAR